MSFILLIQEDLEEYNNNLNMICKGLMHHLKIDKTHGISSIMEIVYAQIETLPTVKRSENHYILV